MVTTNNAEIFFFLGFFMIVGGLFFLYKISAKKVKKSLLCLFLFLIVVGFLFFNFSARTIMYSSLVGKPLSKDELMENQEFEVIFSNSIFSVIGKEGDNRIVVGLPFLPRGTKFLIRDSEIYFLELPQEKILIRRNL